MKGKDPNRGNIVIGPKIQALCDLPTANFGFDSAALDATAKGALDALATCFVSGKAKGKGMRLVGHADPRGETEYNFGLGQKRAASVASYLQGKGVEEARLETSSRGETEATGTDEEGWARDRKVEIFLAE
ncbi:MAG: OmpA family protein [Deltaproteobacteria bacterium]|nr:OmpA family protein [Deltaproteobacteria bacterium]MBW2535047.1 OmpA family protein [Deltaproteobacteria bacterium]